MSYQIICLGNEMAFDDGVGIRVGRILRTLALPQEVTLDLRPQLGLELLDTFQAENSWVIVDAMSTGRVAGECTMLNLSHQELSAQNSLFCCHGMGLAHILEFGRRLFPQRLPHEIVVVGIEVQKLTGFGLSLSEAVQKALPQAVELTLRAVHASPEVILAGIQEAKNNALWEPTPLEAFGG